jgi:hypothetical protein
VVGALLIAESAIVDGAVARFEMRRYLADSARPSDRRIGPAPLPQHDAADDPEGAQALVEISKHRRLKPVVHGCSGPRSAAAQLNRRRWNDPAAVENETTQNASLNAWTGERS